MKERQLVALDNLGEGAAAELFELELQRVLDNIQDPNTKATAVRSVTLTIKIKPDEDRDYGAVSIACVSKMASVNPYPTQLVFGKEGQKNVATEYNPKQSGLFEQPVAKENVVPMAGKQEAK
ncbi:MAG: hypothetical protein WC356_04790 [Candidatus Micrarchaeia archaeon]